VTFRLVPGGGWLIARWRDHEQLRFLVIGAYNTVVGYACFVALYALLHGRLHYLVIGALAHAIAACNAFVAHRRLVFRARGPWFPEFVRFNVAQLMVLAAALVALWLLVSVGTLNPVVAQAIVTMGAVAVSYLAHRRFSFPVR